MILGALLRRAWPYLAIAGLVVLLYLSLGRAAALRQAVRAMERRIQIQEEMRNAGDATPTDRRSVADRLRDGDF